jgi:AcrR family transcriptional regulator
MEARDSGTRSRILSAATTLFVKSGYDGVSTRQICGQAKTSLSGITIHFGSKEKLLNAVIEQMDATVLKAPIRILKGGSESKEEFSTKIHLFFQESLIQMLENRDVILIVLRESERSNFLVDASEYQGAIVEFLEDAQDKDIVSKGIDASMVSGIFMDRILSQIVFKNQIENSFQVFIEDPGYQEKWIGSTVGMFLFGLIGNEERS